MPSSSDTIGQLIRELRHEAGITLDSLAHKLECSKAQLSLMESGQRTISLDWARKIERALGIKDATISTALQWQSIPASIRAQFQQSQTDSQAMLSQLKRALADNNLKQLRKIVERSASNIDAPRKLRGTGARGRPIPGGIPVINKVAAGYPADFTDLNYPASVADDYISCPNISDPDAFAARVVGDSMEPEYHEGDIVIFSPKLAIPESGGVDCFIRLERDNQTTFKRIYFEDDGRTVRLQPLNNAYPPALADRQSINGMYKAAYVMRKVKG